MATTLAQKLQLKPGQTLVALHAPAGYAEALAGQLDGITVTDAAAGPADAVLTFVTALAEGMPRLEEAAGAVRRDGLLWMAYPKGSSGIKTDVNRDRLWAATKGSGWQPVRQVALDDVWSGMRYRPEELVGR
ncbi:MAG: hypothetical protein RLZZ387_5432 [Chloroflexota bacterium]|jgi:hypothetical protein